MNNCRSGPSQTADWDLLDLWRLYIVTNGDTKQQFQFDLFLILYQCTSSIQSTVKKILWKDAHHGIHGYGCPQRRCHCHWGSCGKWCGIGRPMCPIPMNAHAVETALLLYWNNKECTSCLKKEMKLKPTSLVDYFWFACVVVDVVVVVTCTKI